LFAPWLTRTLMLQPGMPAAAELAALRKTDKYSALEKTHFFQPIAVESLGPMNIAAYSFMAELGRKISDVSGDDRESSYLFQRI